MLWFTAFCGPEIHVCYQGHICEFSPTQDEMRSASLILQRAASLYPEQPAVKYFGGAFIGNQVRKTEGYYFISLPHNEAIVTIAQRHTTLLPEVTTTSLQFKKLLKFFGVSCCSFLDDNAIHRQDMLCIMVASIQNYIHVLHYFSRASNRRVPSRISCIISRCFHHSKDALT